MEVVRQILNSDLLDNISLPESLKGRMVEVFIFPAAQDVGNEIIYNYLPGQTPQEESMSAAEALYRLEQYRGRITRDIDIEKERDEYLREKYGSID